MHRPAAKLLLLIACSLLLVSHAPACVPRERDALLAFKQAITSDPAGVLTSWQQGLDCCRWRGVLCSNLTGRVVGLRLRSDDSSYRDALVGQISPSLLALEHLEHLDLSMNKLGGPSGRVPEFLGSLRSLNYLNLSGIEFLGVVPPQLGNLSKLQYLDLSHTGGTNSTDISWLARLRFLQYLNFDGVKLWKIADWPYVLNMIPSLRVVYLSSCLITSANQSLPHLNLTNLEELDLSDNFLNHPITSCWFWNITTLKYLNLGSTSLKGEFPKALEDMTSLRVLDFSYGENNRIMMADLKNLCNLEILNLRTSSLYGDATELFNNLPRCSPNKLQQLYLAENNISGMLPNWIGQLTSLVVLDLSWNNIEGSLPASIGHLTSLRILGLSHNRLIGSIPQEIGMLTNLTQLRLDNNELDGVITEHHFTSTRSLQEIDLSYNSLKIELSSEWQPPCRLRIAYFAACQMGPMFPAWLQWQVDIFYLDISSAGIVDMLPQWFSSAFSKSVYLNISNNQLNGGLPTNMESMSLEGLYLSSNQLTGQIPSLPPNLTTLDISMNYLSGALTSDIGVARLDVLSLFSNRITGRIPESICNYEGLVILDLANNLLEGELPRCSGMREMAFLDLSNNSLSGEFPFFIQNCTYIKFIDLAGNKFSGRLPLWIGNLLSLRLLRLSHNKFFGNVPENITSLVCLQYIDLAHNDISGSLPGFLSNFKAMRRTYYAEDYSSDVAFCFDGDLHEFQLVSLAAVMKGQERNYGSIDRIFNTKVMSIDLSSNYLSGEIPGEIIALDALVNLNLSWNHFTGTVPNRIGAMQSLESLDLSRNKLSGEIPSTMPKLTFLSFLDLSYNNFTGRIPSGQQLDTLYAENPSMYNGNIGLCGPPLQINCSSTGASKRHDLIRIAEVDSGEKFFYLGLVCGFFTGILVVFCTLLFKKGRRVAHFCLLDNI
ncbi:hypothetical protein ACP4OV_027315 [Aristida adscensionis]